MTKIFRSILSLVLAWMVATPSILGAQNVKTLPYILNTKDADERALYTIIDSNKDGNTWLGTNYSFQCSTLGEIPADDWLISPALQLEAGSSYAVVFRGHNKQSDKPEKIALMVGTAPTVEAMTQELIATVTLTKTEEEEFSAIFKPSTSGKYYFGFHCVSEANRYRAYVDAFSVSSPIGQTSPDAVTELAVEPGAKGAMSATITFRSPKKNLDGSAIGQLTRAYVFNRTTQKTIAQIDQPAVGAQLRAKDLSPAQGINKYEVYCTSTSGDGMLQSVEAYIGLDTPKSVTRASWETTANNQARIYWEMPSEKGVHNGYVNPDEVTYMIEMIQPEYRVVAEKVQGTSFIDKAPASFQGQQVLQYAITPTNARGTGKPAPSFRGIFGKPYDVPMQESFASEKLKLSPWFVKTYKGDQASTWNVVAKGNRPQLLPQDNDKGMALMSSDDDGVHALCSPIFALGYDNVLKFWVCQSDPDNQLVVEISTDAGREWQTIHEVGMTTDTWEAVELSLEQFGGKDVIVAFKGTVWAYGREIGVDNISITGTPRGLVEIPHTAPYAPGESRIISLDGKIVSSRVDDGVLRTLPSGFYIIVEGTSVRKVGVGL